METRLEDMTEAELDEYNARLTRERREIRERQRAINVEQTRRQAAAAADRKAAIEAGVHDPGTLLGVGTPTATRTVLGQPDES